MYIYFEIFNIEYKFCRLLFRESDEEANDLVVKRDYQWSQFH